MSRSLYVRLALPLLSAIAAWGQQYTISTIAGNNGLGAGFSGDGGPATAAQLNLPGSIFITSSGSLYIADGSNNLVRLVSGGNISTVAGSSTLGTGAYGGDNGPATAAYLDDPLGVVVDSSGNLYIADSLNQVVRKVTSRGTISTFAGNNSFGAGYTGDAGAATNAQFTVPVGLALDSASNLYIADSGNKVIRKVNTTGTTNTINTAVGILRRRRRAN